MRNHPLFNFHDYNMEAQTDGRVWTKGHCFTSKINVHMLIRAIIVIIVISNFFLSWLDSLQEPLVLLCETLKSIIIHLVRRAN